MKKNSLEFWRNWRVTFPKTNIIPGKKALRFRKFRICSLAIETKFLEWFKVVFDSVPCKRVTTTSPYFPYVFYMFFPTILSKKYMRRCFMWKIVEVLVNCWFEPLTSINHSHFKTNLFLLNPKWSPGRIRTASSGGTDSRDEFDCDFAQLAAARFERGHDLGELGDKPPSLDLPGKLHPRIH